MKYEITQEQLQALGNFLGALPFKDVAPVIQMLQSLPKIPEKDEPNQAAKTLASV